MIIHNFIAKQSRKCSDLAETRFFNAHILLRDTWEVNFLSNTITVVEIKNNTLFNILAKIYEYP